jgi:hypothetical protein
MKFYLVYIEATWIDTSYIIPLIVKADNITEAKARAKELWRETYGGAGKASTPTLDVYLIELITKKTNVLELAEVAPHQNELLKYNQQNKNKMESINGNCTMDGFSRVVVPSELNGFTRVNMILPENMQGYTLNDYELNDYELNGALGRRINRFYRRNAPWSYIGTIVAGVIIADVVTKGAVRKKLGLKKGR